MNSVCAVDLLRPGKSEDLDWLALSLGVAMIEEFEPRMTDRFSKFKGRSENIFWYKDVLSAAVLQDLPYSLSHPSVK